MSGLPVKLMFGRDGMDIDISKVMTYEIKKEMAERYFGFRKLIEEDKQALFKAIHQQSLSIEQKVCLDLARIYTILKDRELIEKFLALSGLEEGFFYDEYMINSLTIRARIFAGISVMGLTRAGRFTKLFLGCYEMLVTHVERYREKFADLSDGRDMINEEIKVFYRKNDLSGMLSFLRSLGEHRDDILAGPTLVGGDEILQKKMEVENLGPLDDYLPVFPPLVEMPMIRRELKKLAEQALKGHPAGFTLG